MYIYIHIYIYIYIQSSIAQCHVYIYIHIHIYTKFYSTVSSVCIYIYTLCTCICNCTDNIDVCPILKHFFVSTDHPASALPQVPLISRWQGRSLISRAPRVWYIHICEHIAYIQIYTYIHINPAPMYLPILHFCNYL